MSLPPEVFQSRSPKMGKVSPPVIPLQMERLVFIPKEKGSIASVSMQRLFLHSKRVVLRHRNNSFLPKRKNQLKSRLKNPRHLRQLLNRNLRQIVRWGSGAEPFTFGCP